MDEVKKYTIKNYVVFGLVMKKTNIAKKCLERILNVKIRDLKYIESEKTEKLAPDLHGIRMDDVPKSLRMFLDYIETDVVQDDYTKEIDEAVIEAQNNKRWRERIMREEWLMQDLVKAKEEAENKEKTMKRETAIRMLNRGEFPDDTICEIADITFNELEEIKKNRKSVK